MRIPSLVVIISSALAVGCGDEGTLEEPSPVGTWREVINPETLVQPEGNWTIRTFGADGSYSEDPDGPARAAATFSGSYQISSGRIAYPSADGTVVNSDFALTDDGHLLLWVMRPVGTVDGVVGNWDGTVSYRRGDERWVNDLRLNLEDDGSATFRTLVELAPDEPPVYVQFAGFWDQEANFLRFSSSYTFYFMVSPGAIAQTAMIQLDGP